MLVRGWLGRLPVLLLAVVGGNVAAQQLAGTDLVPDRLALGLSLAAFGLGGVALALRPSGGHVAHRAPTPLSGTDRDRNAGDVFRSRRARVERVLEGHDYPKIVFQPIADLQSGEVSGYEALSRFSVGRPDEWFAEAAAVGLGIELELKAIRRALRNLEQLPGDAPYLSVNASPETLMSAELRDLLAGTDVRRVVVELTEHVSITDYEVVRRAISHLRARGVRLAVDDVGAGYASLRHIATLEPDIIKLDRSFTKALGSDATERSMVVALVGVGQALGATIVAEGIEDEAGYTVARDLGVQAGQGWHIGRPQSLAGLSLIPSLPRQRPAAEGEPANGR